MDRRKNILKNTFRFVVSFIIINAIFLIILGVMLLFVPKGVNLMDFVPMENPINPDDLNWEAIHELGGYGMVIDNEGNIIKRYYQEEDKKSYTYQELMDLFNLRRNDKTTFSYSTDNNKLLIVYPSSMMTATPTINARALQKTSPHYIQLVFIFALLIYIFLVYIIISILTKRLKKEFNLIKAEEDKRKSLFFRGLAHDVKTPLSTVITYSKALEDGIVDKSELKNYYEVIYKNGILLKERIDNMLSLTTLGDEGIFSPQEADLLEEIRRFIGDNYSWFVNHKAGIHIEFSDDARFITRYDKKLFIRLLENLLQNSVYHNNKPVNIFIEWENKERCLIIYDDGVGVPEKIRPYMWEPMVTGEESRTGEKLRGMGLANVKKIVELHGWKIEYDDGKFKIKIKQR